MIIEAKDINGNIECKHEVSLECANCGAVFKLRHDMDESYYKVEFCPFCGDTIDEESNFDQDEE